MMTSLRKLAQRVTEVDTDLAEDELLANLRETKDFFPVLDHLVVYVVTQIRTRLKLARKETLDPSRLLIGPFPTHTPHKKADSGPDLDPELLTAVGYVFQALNGDVHTLLHDTFDYAVHTQKGITVTRYLLDLCRYVTSKDAWIVIL